jgi:hypothetical protein
MFLAIPTIEITGHADLIGARSPDSEGNSALAFVGYYMRTELFIDPFMLSFIEEM